MINSVESIIIEIGTGRPRMITATRMLFTDNLDMTYTTRV
jgi:hypothetical protein